jgi:hypothetical protein
VESASGVNNIKARLMDNDLIEAEEWPQGLYMIFVKTDTEAAMGRVIDLTQTTAVIRPWNFMWGRVDEDQTYEVVLADQKEVFAFDSLAEMDVYFATHYWRKYLDNNIQRGTII